MEEIFEKISEYIRGILMDWVLANLRDMFELVNNQVALIGSEVTKTPSGWNGDIYAFIKSMADNVMVPIAGLILTYVLCYELIMMVCDRNNLNDGQTFMFFKYILKMCVAVYFVTHTFEITMAIFDLGQDIVNKAMGVINDQAVVDVESALEEMANNQLKDMSIGELISLVITSMFVKISIYAISLTIEIILLSRMIEIYLYASFSPVPFATLTNKEWGNIGTNFIRALLALAFQGFFIMVCVGIYGVLVKGLVIAGDIEEAILNSTIYAFVLCVMLLRTGSMSKSLFGAH